MLQIEEEHQIQFKKNQDKFFYLHNKDDIDYCII